jgi:hypothetical protein
MGWSFKGTAMADSHAQDTNLPLQIQSSKIEFDRRAQTRYEGVLNRIEDTTYAILRKHEKKSA